MTEAFWDELEEEKKARAQLLGSYPLKGMEEGTRIFRWVERDGAN
jgi:hypothetical protein